MRAIFLIPLAIFAAGAAKAEGLNVGDKAPALKVAKWVKGEPIAAFEPGKVYVVEFWATWCGPCKQSIPHLTELAKKYDGKVAFTGVAIQESQDEDFTTKVPKFVADMGDKMNYRVATDDKRGGTMFQTWFQAAGEKGIPSSFVVDQKGQIAWIGHPMIGLDEVLEQVVAGRWDSKIFAARRQMELDAEAKAMSEKRQAFAGVNAAIVANDPKKAIAELEKAIPLYPKFANNMRMMKFSFMLNVEEKAAYPFAEELANGPFANDPNSLNTLAWDIAENPKLKSPDYPLAVRIAEKALALTGGKDWMVMDTLAWSQYKAGEKVKALENQRKAVAMAKADKADATLLKELQDRLSVMEKG